MWIISKPKSLIKKIHEQNVCKNKFHVCSSNFSKIDPQRKTVFPQKEVDPLK